MSDASTWLSPVSESVPSGENLENDPDFGAMERAALGKPEQLGAGDKLIPAVPPDWREVDTLASGLMARTRDLRVLAYVATARLNRTGPAAFADVIETIAGLVRTQWAMVHPQLDPEDDNDPTPRVNALHRLGSPGAILVPLRNAVIARSKRAGPVSYRQVAVLAGTMEAEPGVEYLSDSEVRAAFNESAASVAAIRAALGRAEAGYVALREAFDAHTRPGTGPNDADLIKLLREMQRAIEKFAVDPAAVGESLAEADGAPDAEAAAPDLERPSGPQANISVVRSRAEALRLLDLIVQYYERSEPSSPVPLVIARARRLAEMNFLDILTDMAPDGVSQARHVAGVRDE